MTDITDTQETLVLGGTGKTGRRVAQRLMARGPGRLTPTDLSRFG